MAKISWIWDNRDKTWVGTLAHGKYEIQPYEHGFMVYYYERGDNTPMTSDSFKNLAVAKQECEAHNLTV